MKKREGAENKGALHELLSVRSAINNARECTDRARPFLSHNRKLAAFSEGTRREKASWDGSACWHYYPWARRPMQTPLDSRAYLILVLRAVRVHGSAVVVRQSLLIASHLVSLTSSHLRLASLADCVPQWLYC
jgi:hypothetical protein